MGRHKELMGQIDLNIEISKTILKLKAKKHRREISTNPLYES